MPSLNENAEPNLNHNEPPIELYVALLEAYGQIDVLKRIDYILRFNLGYPCIKTLRELFNVRNGR